MVTPTAANGIDLLLTTSGIGVAIGIGIEGFDKNGQWDRVCPEIKKSIPIPTATPTPRFIESRIEMHEMGLATEIVRIVVESIPGDLSDPKVERVNLKVGKLAAVVPQSLKFCFEIVAKDGPADGAELHIEEVGVSARCNDCAHQWEIDQPAFQCPKCDSGSIEVLSGRELDIESIELADD